MSEQKKFFPYERRLIGKGVNLSLGGARALSFENAAKAAAADYCNMLRRLECDDYQVVVTKIPSGEEKRFSVRSLLA